ncbi:MAG TPA: hypothetical protein VMM57_10885 [Bacteroidota bacterium]|nr:hypothetical protein [Bacteroidota bacterium]
MAGDGRRKERNYHRIIQTLWLGLGFCAVCFVAMYDLSAQKVRWQKEWNLLYLSIPAFVVGLSLLPSLHRKKKTQFARILSSLRQDHWVHWVYSIPEWKKWIDVERKLAARRALLFPVGALAVEFALALLYGWAWKMIALAFPMFLACALASGAAVFCFEWFRGNVRERSPGEFLADGGGMIFHGLYCDWNAEGARAHHPEAREGNPGELRFSVGGSRPGPMSQRVRIPIPEGKEDEAARFVARLSDPE